MSRPININETLTFAPTSNVSTTNLSASSSYPASNGYTDASSTTYARFSVTRNQVGSTYYVFSVTGIPSGATISSVSCVARIYIYSTTYVTNTRIQLYSGTTAKGTSGTFASTSSTNTVTLNGGSWTVSELENARLYITGQGSNNNSNRYIYFYGATLSVTYSLQGTEYEITSTLATDAVDSIDPAGQTYVMGGEDYELNIYADDISNITVEDNGNDVTSSLVYVQEVPETTSTFIPSSYDSANSQVAGTDTSNPPANGLTNADSTTRAAFTSNTTAYSTTNFYYNFDCSSIPRNATITSVSCSFKATCSSNYFNTRVGQLCTGTTKKGTGTTITNTSVNNTVYVQQITDTGTWTREELDDIKILIEAIRGSSTNNFTLSFYGATLTVTYKAEEHYSYTLTNVQADHTIIISDAIIEIPEEDPQYNYYPITISSINATTDPRRGTTRVVAGTNETITITPSESQVTLILDNGVDVSSQLVSHGTGTPTYTVTTASGASYGFNLNNSTGYYVSTNTGQSNSAAVSRVNLNLPVRCLITFTYINYAEATYDYGIFGNIDSALGTTYTADSNVKLACNTSTYNTAAEQTLTYEVDAGQHFIDVKYRKDSYTDSNNDSLQFKLEITELEANNYYTYTLSNINQAHSLIFVFGNVSYYFVNTSSNGPKLYPNGQFVVLPGDSYKLVIVPEDYDDTITVTDNNTDVTNSLQQVTTEIEKDGETITAINYIYRLSNINATHTIEVTKAGSSDVVYLKVNGSWRSCSKVYKKVNNVWVEQTNFSNLFDSNKIYIKV